MGSVAGALLGAVRASPDARLQESANENLIGLRRPAQDPSHGGANVSARLIERDASAHRLEVLLGQARVSAPGARLLAVQASIDGSRGVGGVQRGPRFG